MSPVLVGRTVLQEMVNFVELVFMGQAVVFCPGGSDSLAGDGPRRRTRVCGPGCCLLSWWVEQSCRRWFIVIELVFVGQAAVFCPGGSDSVTGDGPRRRTRVCGPGCCSLVGRAALQTFHCKEESSCLQRACVGGLGCCFLILVGRAVL